MRALGFATVVFTGALVALVACSEGSAGDDLGQPDSSTQVPGIDAGSPDVAVDAPSETPVCGDGKRAGTEACDDGNAADNDGCSSVCALESAFEGDVCPGKAVTLTTVGQSLRGSITGTTKGAYNHYGSACGGGTGRDVVYTFTPTTSGKAVIKATADYPLILSSRSDCGAATSESKCADVQTSTGGSTTMEVPVFASTPVFLFVDGYGGSSGDFTIDIDISLAVCGNGVAELPETCDDGNTTNGDGCSQTCAFEAGGVLGQCPGQPFLLTGTGGAPRKISLAGNTATEGGDTQASAGCINGGGKNIVYALKSDVSGNAKIAMTAGYADPSIHARSDCASSSLQTGCQGRQSPGPLAFDLPVVGGQWFYLFVDSNNVGGPFTVDVTVTPAACGNGVLDGNEPCDDANSATGDGCTDACELEPLAGIDACPGNAVALASQPDGSYTAVRSGTTKELASTINACGSSSGGAAPDAIFAVTPDIEGLLTANVKGPFNTVVSIMSTCAAAPDANTACSFQQPTAQGTIPKTTSRAVLAGTTYYVVVSASSTSGTQSSGPFQLDLHVTPPVCGNDVLEGSEACDDGATDPGDGCDATCHLEPITSRSTCATAEAVALTPGTPGTYSASIKGGTTNLLANGNFYRDNQTTETCHALGRNAFYEVTVPESGVFRATAKSSYFDVVLGVHKPTCIEIPPGSVTPNPFACTNATTRGSEESLAFPVTVGEKLWVVVDGKTAGEFGRFDLQVSVTPSGCGDGFFVPGPTEACDDGNTENGDGCSSTCTLEALAGVDVCPGTPITLSGAGLEPRRGSVTFSTAGLSANYSGACGGNAPEGVVKVVAPVNGVLRARILNVPDGTLYGRSVCDDPGTEFLKTSGSTCPNVVHDVVQFPVTAGAEYFLFADGLNGATGVPTVDVTITP